MIQMQIRKHKNVRKSLTIYRIACNTYSQNTSSHKLPPTKLLLYMLCLISALSAQVHLDDIPVQAFADNEIIELNTNVNWREGEKLTIPGSTKVLTLVACNVRNKASQIGFYFIPTLRNNDVGVFCMVLCL